MEIPLIKKVKGNTSRNHCKNVMPGRCHHGWLLLHLSFILFLSLAQRAWTAPAFPIQPSADGRYLVDAKSQPFLWLADSGWTLVKKLTPADRDAYLDSRAAQGFTVIQFHAVSKEAGLVTTFDGLAPFEPLDNILKPVPAYWQRVDDAIAACEKRGLVAAVSAIWIRSGGDDREGWRYTLTDDNARDYGRFLGKRFSAHKNLAWILGGDANPRDRALAIAELARGIKEFAPHQLITVHNAPDNPSAGYFHNEPWLDINFAYTYKEVYQQVYAEWHRLPPVKPIVLGEAGYEMENNDRRGGDPYRIRRQLWDAALSGALGGQAYGHRDIWRFSEKWRASLNAPGAKHLQVFKDVYTRLPWAGLEPDAEHTPMIKTAKAGSRKTWKILTQGTGSFGKDDYATAAHARDGGCWLAYLPTPRMVACDFGCLEKKQPGKSVFAWWIDPTTGERRAVQGSPFTPGQTQTITSPDKNAAGDPDWVLLAELRGPSNVTGK